MQAPTLTGVPFNDAYRYMDWLLTVPLLLIEILLVMKLPAAEFSSKAWSLGLSAALMIVSGYYGELVVTGDLTPRWMCWFISMAFFLYIVYELLVGLAAATASEEDPVIASKIGTAQVMTVISWCTYPVVYLFPMFGISASQSVVGIQVNLAWPMWHHLADAFFCIALFGYKRDEEEEYQLTERSSWRHQMLVLKLKPVQQTGS